MLLSGAEDLPPFSETEQEIAKIIEGHVGYETPIQWRIAKSLAEREDRVIIDLQTEVKDHQVMLEYHKISMGVQVLADSIDKLPRWKPVTRTTLVHMFNGAFGLATPATTKWWQYRPSTGGPIEGLMLTVIALAGVLFIFEIIRQLVLIYGS